MVKTLSGRGASAAAFTLLSVALAGAAAVGIGSVVAGLAAARQWELAPGGAIVLTAVAVFAVTTIGASLLRRAGTGSVVPQL